jgi:uncharacterized membrane protein
MDWYTLIKFLHVLAAIIWIGGVFTMPMISLQAQRSGDDTGLVRTVGQMGWAADRIFVPGGIATAVLGVVVATLGHMWGDLWIILGLVGVAITTALGILALTPRVKRVAGAGAVTPETIAISRQTVTLVKFDSAALFVVVADMVLKPQIGDWTTVTIMALVLVAAAGLWLAPGLRKVAAA